MKPIYYINASLLTKGSCNVRVIRTAVDGYFSDINYNDTFFGTCWHFYREQLLITKNHTLAMMAALDKWETTPKAIRNKKQYIDTKFLLNAITAFHNRFNPTGNNPLWYENINGFAPIYVDGKPLAESTFAIPVFTSDSFDLVLCGTLDRVGFVRGTLCIEDDKTSGFTGQVDAFLNQFATSLQFRLYFYIVNKLKLLFPETPLGKLFASASHTTVRIFGVLHAEGMIKFETSGLFSYSEREILKFQTALDNRIALIAEEIQAYTENKPMIYKGLANGDCKEFVFTCPYLQACSAESEELEIHELEKFGKRIYNPIQKK